MPSRPPDRAGAARLAPAPEPVAIAAATTIAIAIATASFLAIALTAHPVGDYHAESDFYGGYAAGARLIERGHLDPARYPVVGPVYECALALIGILPLDLFLLAKLLSVASAAAVLSALATLVQRRMPGRATGAIAALALIALLAVNPIFVRYAYSATTDMLALALSSAALLFLLGGGDRSCVAAGALAALAALTRYSAAALLPAGILALALWPPAGASRRSAIARFAAGFALPALPWTLYALAHHAVPGGPLLRYFSFYANPSADRSVQDLGPAAPDSLRAYQSLGELLQRDPGAFVSATLRNIPQHLALEARGVLGWPCAALAVAGAALALLSRTALGLGALWLIGALQFLTLAPVFHSERYALPLVPIELSLAAFALAWSVTRARTRALPVLATLAGVLAVALTLRDCVATQREVRRLLPVETIEAGSALRVAAAPGSRVIARKGQIGYYSGLEVIAFPRVARLAELAAYARAAHADYLYYSWYEAQLRPEFAWMLDSTAAAPGLERVHATASKRSMLFRLGGAFGQDPAWLADPYLRRLHESRALVGVLPDSLTVPYRITLGVDALSRGDPVAALAWADQALALRADQPLAWQVRGEALLKLGRAGEAAAAFERSLALAPDDPETRAALDSARAIARGAAR